MNILPKTCLCERWSPHKTTTLIKKSDKHLSYFVSRMSFGCNFLIFFFYAWLLSAWTGSGKYMFLSNICMERQWTNTITDSGSSQGQNVAFLTTNVVQPCVCVGVCGCSCSCYILKTKMLILLPKQRHLHLPLWSFFPLVFFFLSRLGGAAAWSALCSPAAHHLIASPGVKKPVSWSCSPPVPCQPSVVSAWLY